MGQLFPIFFLSVFSTYTWKDLCLLCIKSSILSQTSSSLEHFSQQITQWEASWKQPELSLTSQPLTDFPWLFCYTKVCFFYTNQHQFWITVNTIAPEHRSQKTINKELIEIYSILHLQLTLRGYQLISIKSLLPTKTLKEILIPTFVTALVK